MRADLIPGWPATGTTTGFGPARVIGLRRLAAALVLTACSASVQAGTPENLVDSATTIVSTESALLSGPVDIAVDEDGLVYVLDYSAAHVVVLGPDGDVVRIVGRAGSGPGEFRRPSSLSLAGDSLRVADPGNARLQTFSRTGGIVGTVPMPPTAAMGPIAIAPDGGFLVTTLGLHDALAAYHDPAGSQVQVLGTPLDSVLPVMNPRQMKEDLAAGRVPALFSNATVPAFAANGDFWLVLNGHGRVQRYTRTGELDLTVTLGDPEMKLVRDEAVAAARARLDTDEGPPTLLYVRHAEVDGPYLWLLLKTARNRPAVLVAVDGSGRLAQRVRFTSVRGAGAFAIDRARGRVVFTMPEAASLVTAPMPPAIP